MVTAAPAAPRSEMGRDSLWVVLVCCSRDCSVRSSSHTGQLCLERAVTGARRRH